MANLENDNFEEYTNLTFHPYNIILTLVLGSVTALFLAFSGAYMYNRFQNPEIEPIRLPSLFFINTIVLIGSSLGLNHAKKCYKNDNTEGYTKALWFTVIITFIFLILQMIAWAQLFQSMPINHNNMASYLYIISGLHFMHVIAGLPFLMFFLWVARNRMKEPVSVLVYFSDPEKRLSLRLLTIYWHFLDFLWIYLVIFFGVNYLMG